MLVPSEKRLYLALTRPQKDWEEDVRRAKKWHDEVLQEFEPTKNLAMQQHAQGIADRIVRMAGIPIVIPKVTVLKGNEVNAFTTGGGNIYLFEGLMEKVKSDDELAMVIAHELGHCSADHIGGFYWLNLKQRLRKTSENLRFPQVEISEKEYTYKGKKYLEISMDALKPEDVVILVLTYVTSAFSRQEEHEADVLGGYYMSRAGYDLAKGIDLFFGISQQEAELRREAIKEIEPLYIHLNKTFKDYITVKEKIHKDPLGAVAGLYKVEEEAYLKRWLEAKDKYEQCAYKWRDALFQIPAWFRSHPPVSERINYLREAQDAIKERKTIGTSTKEVSYTLEDLWLVEKGLPFPEKK
ncbi:MAG: M48 family metalloprotease [Nitrospirota bacterium]